MVLCGVSLWLFPRSFTCLKIETHATLEMMYRFTVCVNLIVAAALSIIYVPFPEICDGIIHYIVKRVDYIIANGESSRQCVCKCVQPDGEDARSVVEENEQGDGEDGSDTEDEFGGTRELESDGSKDD